MPKEQTPQRTTHVRIGILCLILFLSVVAYADRSILSISGSAIKEEFGLSAIQLGLILCFQLGLCHRSDSWRTVA